MSNDEIFSLSAGSDAADASQDWLALDTNRKITRDEQRIQDEYNKQLLVIQLEAELTRRGQGYISDLHLNAERTFVTMADKAWEMRLGKRDKVLQQLIDIFTRENIMQGGAQIKAATAAGSRGILAEVQRALYMASEEEQQSLFTWLFGGRNDR